MYVYWQNRLQWKYSSRCRLQESDTQTHICKECKHFEAQTKYIDQHHIKKTIIAIDYIQQNNRDKIRNKINEINGAKTDKARNWKQEAKTPKYFLRTQNRERK